MSENQTEYQPEAVTQPLFDGIEKLRDAIDLIGDASVGARDAEWGGIAALNSVLETVWHTLVAIEVVANAPDDEAAERIQSTRLVNLGAS